jgi:hypothetical protein
MLRTPSKIEVGKIDARGYNGAPQAMSKADKPKWRNKALAASSTACIGAVICFLCSEGGISPGLIGTCPDLIGTPPFGGVNSRLSQLVAHAITQRGCAALTCGKPPAFRPVPHPSFSSTQAGRLGLPACGEEVIQEARPSERQSLSANQAAQPRTGWSRAQPQQSSSSPQLPPCIAQSAFFKSIPKGFHWPDPGDALSLRVLEEYGAIFVARGGVVLPPVVIFADQNAVAHWQSNLSTEQAELAGIPVRLQSAAMRALMKAREEAFQAHVGISPRGPDAAQRSYDQTLELWRSRVNPGLQHWVDKGLLSAVEAERIRKLPARQQVPKILELEKRGLYFSKDFSKSVLLSVAPPGASQHLSMLAFDVKQHDNPVVRLILEHHGWFQTVRSDLPHFTYLGVNKHLLPSLGLKMVRNGDRMFWIPDFACPPPANP